MFEREPGQSAERDLWQTVLRQTVEDALIGVAQESKRHDRVRICESARNYLSAPSKDLSMICAMAGVDMHSVIERMRIRIANAPSPEELASERRIDRRAFNKKPKQKKEKRTAFKDQEYTINGTTKTASEWCDINGITLGAAWARILKGWGAEKAFTMSKEEARAEVLAKAREVHRESIARQNGAPADAAHYEHDGQSLTLTEWSDKTGILKATIVARLRSGWSFHDAITTPVKPRTAA